MPKIEVLWGLPASGKSQYAEKKARDSRGSIIRINKDSLRAMITGVNEKNKMVEDKDGKKKPYRMPRKHEKNLIIPTRNFLIELGLRQGKNIIVDDTNLNPTHLESIKKIAAKFSEETGQKVEVTLKKFEVPLEECIERDKKRDNPVGAKVIRRMYNDYFRPTRRIVEVLPLDPDLSDCVIYGVTDLKSYTAKFKFLRSISQNANIILISDLKEDKRNLVENWFNQYFPIYKEIHFPQTDKDPIEFRKEIYEKHIKGKYNVRFALESKDDHVDTWRKLKIKSFQEKQLKKYFIDSSTNPEAVICDLDGTACLFNQGPEENKRSPFDGSKCENDLPDREVLWTLNILKEQGKKIVFVSGRSDEFRPQTENWLKKNFPEYEALYMRKKGDVRKDVIIKQEIFENDIKDKYKVLVVLDDRNQTVEGWRQLGLPCLQVEYGNF